MGDRPLFEVVVGGGNWPEGKVPLVWVQIGLETQGNDLKSVSIVFNVRDPPNFSAQGKEKQGGRDKGQQ